MIRYRTQNTIFCKKFVSMSTVILKNLSSSLKSETMISKNVYDIFIFQYFTITCAYNILRVYPIVNYLMQNVTISIFILALKFNRA